MIGDLQRIEHILKAISKIYDAANCTQDEFLESALKQDAVSYNFLIIGEASGQISDDLKEAHPEVPWRIIVGMRNVLIHDLCPNQLQVSLADAEKRSSEASSPTFSDKRKAVITSRQGRVWTQSASRVPTQ